MNDTAQAPEAEPPDAFWEDDLEMPVAALRAAAESDEFMMEWLAERNGPQIAVLRRLLRLRGEVPTRSGKKQLQGFLPHLRRFVPVQRFSRNKKKAAVIDFAERRLPPAILALAAVGESYEPSALIYAIYDRDWNDLVLVHGLEKIYRKGCARMRLTERLRRPKVPVGEFLRRPTVERILADYDRKAADGRTSQFKSHIPHDGTDLVFVRRAEKASLLMQGTRIIHGFAPEWIILDFRQSAYRVNICSESSQPSLEIANAIASAYYERPCEYDNDRVAAYPQQLRRLFDRLLADEAHGIGLAEVRVRNSPLDGAPKLRVSAAGDLPVAPAVRQLSQTFGPLLANLQDVEAIKTSFRGKRVSLIFDDGSEDGDPLPPLDTDPDERPLVVRYTDSILTVAERQAFEQLMEEVHGITVVSTEKRFRS